MSICGYEYDRLADAVSIRNTLDFIATTAYGRMMATNSTFVAPSFAGVFAYVNVEAIATNIEFVVVDSTDDAAKYYAGTVHLNKVKIRICISIQSC